MELFLELIVSSFLIAGLCYFIFDIDFKKIIVIFFTPMMLIAFGFIMGIGIHLCNFVFGW